MSLTNALGEASFIIPEGSYKVRVDVDGTQHWSDTINIIGYQLNQVGIELSELTAANNPRPVRYDGQPPVYYPLLAAFGDVDRLFVQPIVGEPRTYYFVSDHLGTGQLLVNDAQVVVWQGENTPFGETTVVVDQVGNNFRFPGQYYDTETGLHYNWHRYYDSSTGRYISADPIGLQGGINLYGYANQNPVMFIDPMGLAWKVSGGFGATLGIYHASYSMSTEACCDENGKKHVRSIESICWGMRLGVSINAGNTGPGGSSVSFGGKKPGKCKGKGETGPDSTFMTENYDKEFSSGVVLGASWSPSDPTKTTLTAGELGFGLTLSSKCWNSVLQDEVVGCCNE